MHAHSHRGLWIGIGVIALLLVAAAVLAGPWIQQLPGTASARSTSLTATRLEPVRGSQSEVLQVLLRSASDQDAVSTYLRQEGFRILHAGLRGRMLVVQADAATIATALRAHLYHWQAKGADGTYVAADATPHLSDDIAARVTAIYGLNRSVHGAPTLPWDPQPFPLSAEQIQTAYHVTPLLSEHVDGRGIRVAIYALGGFDRKYVDNFAGKDTPGYPLDLHVYATDDHGDQRAPYPSTNPCQICINEVLQDIDAVHTMAPGATIDVYEFSPESDFSSFAGNLLEFMDRVAANNDLVASISDTACDQPRSGPGNPGFSVQELDGLDSVFQSDGLNVSIFAGSGDWGAWCPLVTSSESPTKSDLLSGTSFPASDPNVTGVGGTTLILDVLDDHINQELAWDSDFNPLGPLAPLPIGAAASGGGASGYFPRPCWQTGPGVPVGPARMVPDVSADAAIQTGLKIENTGLGWVDVGTGTSLSAPLWAGVAALFDQYARAHHDQLLGNANPLLYRLATTAKNRPLFDVTGGDGRTSDLATPLPQPGWDASTGLGSMNAWTFVHDGASPTYTPPCQTPTPVAPLLGMPWDPSLHQQGFGTVRPEVVNNGGDPTGYFTISWDTWGSGTAIGHGTALWVPAGTPVAAGTTEPALFEAFDLGTCQGKSVYLHLAVWFPQHGQNFDPNDDEASYTLCPP
ncbi:S53 family peptidase [Microbacterium sp. ASV49]|uniref:Protease pro-enzyme activation domain-containing protein n=1 Tax=Microbacterium candidum TaxID=3041922 RepID=A0ABT7MVY0_9MICO|nr:protease pro-enzyme activation domain-containing protein [Microbacterium sp. ASV49]MDL9978609.1 protease pro-enzyme activation domain-containing protein [Microbacterium sp. ASV49]